MNFFDNYIQLIVEGIISFIVLVLIHRWNSRKPRLIYYITNMSKFTLPGPPSSIVGTHTIMIQNLSKLKAEEIEICHTSATQYFEVYPDIPHTIDTTPQGGQIIKFRDLPPKNSIIISYLYVFTLGSPSYLPQYVRSKDRYVKEIKAITSPLYPKWMNVVAGIFMFLGFVFLINLIYELIKAIFKF